MTLVGDFGPAAVTAEATHDILWIFQSFRWHSLRRVKRKTRSEKQRKQDQYTVWKVHTWNNNRFCYTYYRTMVWKVASYNRCTG